jgi:predicted nucleic-acid-binding protein
LRRFCSSQGVRVESEATVVEALRLFEHGSADLSDYFSLETARRADALPLRTFDEPSPDSD